MYSRKRTCEWCGKEFIAMAPNQRYCSSECKKQAQRERRKIYRKRRIERGRGYSPKPKLGDKCIRCGYDILYALEYSHECNGFLCANCHRFFHPGSRRRISKPVPVQLKRVLYDPGFPYEPTRCYLCKQPITPEIWEMHHMIPKAAGGDWAGSENIVIICANCHRILTRAKKFIDEYFIDFLRSERNPYYPHYTTYDRYRKLSIAIQVKIVRNFYIFLSEIWDSILEQLRRYQSAKFT